MVFRISGKAPHSKDKLIRLLSGVLSSSLNIFNIFVGIRAGPVFLLELSDFISSSISSGSVGDRKNVCEVGLSRKSWYLVSVCMILSSIFCATEQKNVFKECAISKGLVTSWSSSLIQLIVLFNFLEILIIDLIPSHVFSKVFLMFRKKSLIMFRFIDLC